MNRLGIAVSVASAASIVARVDANSDGLTDIHEFHELYDSIPKKRKRWPWGRRSPWSTRRRRRRPRSQSHVRNAGATTSSADSALHLLRGESPPSLQLYTAIIDSFYKQHQPHRAEGLWRAMVDDHSNASNTAPDTAAYNVRIWAMREEAGLRPDVVSYNALMRAMSRHGRVDEAVEVYRSLQEQEEGKGSAAAKSAPDCATYTCVVGALCRSGRWSEAEDVFYEGVKRRKVADLGTVRAGARAQGGQQGAGGEAGGRRAAQEVP